MQEIKYGPEVRNGYIRFGYGDYYDDELAGYDINLQGKPNITVELARLLGWSHGCPVAKALSDSSNEQFGPGKIAVRYSKVNRMFQTILKYATTVNTNLAIQIATPIQRLQDEPVSFHEPESVPRTYLRKMAPMTTIYGYALPRIVIELRKYFKSEGSILYRWAPNFIIHSAVRSSTNPADLSIALADCVVKEGVEPVLVLQHILSREVLGRENCRSIYIDLAERLGRSAPDTLRAYLGLSSREKAELDIAEIPTK